MDWEEFDRKVQVAASYIAALRQSAGKSSSQRTALPKAVGELQAALEALQAAKEELRQARGERETQGQERTAELAQTNQALQAGAAERSRMEVQLSARNRELLTLHRLSEILIRTPSLEAACHEIVEEIGAATGFPCLAIELYDEARQKMVFKAARGIPLPPGQETLEVPVEETLSGMVARTGRPVIETNAGQRPEYANEILRQIKARTFICLPMIVDGRVVGTLSLAHPKAVRVDERLTEWLESLANCVAALIEHKRVEQERRQLAAIVESSDDAIISKTLDGIITSWNKGAERIFGYTAEEVKGRHISLIIPPDYTDEEPQILEKLERGERIDHYETVRVRKDGQLINISLTSSPIKNAIGQVIGASKIARDITERKRADEALRKSEREFRLVVDNLPALISYVSSDQHYRFVNKQYEGRLGLPRTQIVGKSIKELLGEEAYELLRDYIETVLSGRPASFETALPLRFGGLRWMSVSYVPDFDGQGRVNGFFVLATDVTDSKRTEERLRKSESMLAAAEAIAHLGSYEVNLDTPEEDHWSEEAFRILGLEPAQGPLDRHRYIQRVVHPEDQRRVAEAVEEMITKAAPCDCEYRIVRPDGAIRDVHSVAQPLTDEAGRVVKFVGTIRDMTEQKQAEEALHTSQAQMAGIIASAMDAIITVDAEQRVTLFNAAAEKMFRCSAAEALGQPLDRFVPERFRAAHREHIRAFGETQVTRRSMGALGDLWGARTDGEEFPIEASISQIEVEGQKFFTAILRDITKRKRAEERLIEQATLLDHAQDAILVRSLENRILFWSRGAERLYGWTAGEAVGRPCRDLIYPAGSSQLEEATRAVIEQGEWIGELQQVTKDGKEIMVEGHWTLVHDESGKPKSILAINTDITEKKKLEARFLRAQRLESIGTLAGGIAHDLNNILSPILMAVHMLQQRFTDEGSQRWLETMRVNAHRGADLVKQVLTFARGAGGQRVQLSPKHLVKDLVKVLTDTFPKSIEIGYLVPNELWSVKGDATELYQVLMNLCLNARDAMPSGGRLSITAENTRLDETYARMRFGTEPGCFVLLTVTDTGGGIQPEIMEKIFDPFFTTKEVGQGTGLGLSTVLGIVKSHGGLIDVYSEVGRGTTFKIYLPAVERGQLKPQEEERRDLPAGHGELILVVDDEAAIREITKGALETYGYRVLTANDGPEAVARCAEHKGEVKAALVDMMMPVMDGAATTRALRRLDSQLKVIATSGLQEESRATEAAQAGADTFLAKPYTAESLLKTLAEALNAERQSQSA
jgi:hypothetical protein